MDTVTRRKPMLHPINNCLAEIVWLKLEVMHIVSAILIAVYPNSSQTIVSFPLSLILCSDSGRKVGDTLLPVGDISILTLSSLQIYSYFDGN